MLRLGDHAAYCQVCGFRYLASELKRRWDGLLVCGPDWEPQHDIDLRRPLKIDESLPAFVRPDDELLFVSNINFCLLIADQTGAGCSAG